MNTLIFIAFWLGVFTLLFICIKIFLIVLTFIIAIPVAIIQSISQSRRDKKKWKGLEMAAKERDKAIRDQREKDAKDAAYNSAVEKFSTIKKKPVTKKTIKK